MKYSYCLERPYKNTAIPCMQWSFSVIKQKQGEVASKQIAEKTGVLRFWCFAVVSRKERMSNQEMRTTS